MSDLMQRLIDAATESITNQEPAITGPSAGHLRGVVLDLEINGQGAVIDSTCYVERRGVHRTRKAT